LVIAGVEVSTDQGEILVFGLHRGVRDLFRAEELRKRVDEEGGFMILAHPFRNEPSLYASFPFVLPPPEKRSFPEVRGVGERTVFTLVDALEVYNGRAGRQETAFARAVAEHLNLGGTGGSDAHAVLGIGACYTRFFEPVRDERDLIVQLKKGNYQAVDARWTVPSEEES
jgi:predicted metal-dependent phosphoesterase TrpH